MKQRARRIISVVLSATLFASLVPNVIGSGTVLASETKNQDNSSLCTSEIANPVSPDSPTDAWKGNYVYFGTYEGNPIKFRVLDKNSNRFGGSSLFLDSDFCLFSSTFGNNTNLWRESELQQYLNGEFYAESFGSVEKSSILRSVLSGDIEYPSGSYEEYKYGHTVGLNDYVFVLDADDVLNPVYGYSSDPGFSSDYGWLVGYSHNATNHRKGFASEGNRNLPNYWLRSACVPMSDAPIRAGAVRFIHVNNVTTWGLVEDGATYENLGVAPALNVDLSSVLLSTIINGKSGSDGAEYKLTLEDKNLSVNVQSGKEITADGSKVSVPYSITGSDAENATRVSVLILDKEYKPGNTNSAKILYYDGLNGTFEKTATGTFTLPSSLNINDWGSKYYVYLIAEDINGTYESDYASAPVKLNVPKVIDNKQGWVNEGNNWFYYDAKGTKVTDWQQISGTWYFFDDKGVMQTGWVESAGKWYYMKDTGAMTLGWVQDGGKWYYMSASGAMATGWVQAGDKWYFMGASGAMATGWIQSGKYWYYMSSSGAMATGWVQSGKTWYFMNESGAMVTGWQRVGIYWYYFEASGAMKTGWLENGGAKYYLADSGAMVTGKQTIGGKSYEFNSSGALIK